MWSKKKKTNVQRTPEQLARLRDILRDELQEAKDRRKSVITDKEAKEVERIKLRELKANQRFEENQLKEKGLTKLQAQRVSKLKMEAMFNHQSFDELRIIETIKEEATTDKSKLESKCCVCQIKENNNNMGKATCGHVICKRCVAYLGISCPLCDAHIRARDKLIDSLNVDISELTGKALQKAYREKRKIIMDVKHREALEENIEELKSPTLAIDSSVEDILKNDFYQKLRLRNTTTKDNSKAKRDTKEVIVKAKESVKDSKDVSVVDKISEAEMDDIMQALGAASVETKNSAIVVENVIKQIDSTKVEDIQKEILRQARSKKNQKIKLAEKLSKQVDWNKRKDNERRSMSAQLNNLRYVNREWKKDRLSDENNNYQFSNLTVGIVAEKNGKRVRYSREFINRPERQYQEGKAQRIMKEKPVLNNSGNIVQGLVMQEFDIPIIEEEVLQPRVKLGPNIKHHQYISVTDFGEKATGTITGTRNTSIIYQAALVRGNSTTVCSIHRDGKIDLPHVYVQSDWEVVDILEALAELVPEWSPPEVQSFEFKGKTMFVVATPIQGDIELSSVNGPSYSGLIFDWSRIMGFKGITPAPSARKIAKREAYVNIKTLSDSEMRCPLTERRVDNPVLCICSTPHRFERWALKSFIEQHGCCPKLNSTRMNVDDIQEDPEGQADLVKRRSRKDVIRSVQAITNIEMSKGKVYRETK